MPDVKPRIGIHKSLVTPRQPTIYECSLHGVADSAQSLVAPLGRTPVRVAPPRQARLRRV